jgi:outer membrane protein OmpA-like peptidoglycan-associated protein
MRSFPKLAGLAIASILISTGGLMAQSRSRIELGTFGGYTFFDTAEPFDDAAMGGALLGLYALRRLSLEGEASFATTQDTAGADILFIPIRARLLYSQPLVGGLQLLIGPGFVQNLYRRDVDGADAGPSGLLGLRFPVGGFMDVRVDALADYIPKPAPAGVDKSWHYGARLGVGLRLGPSFGERPRPTDFDGDGIADAVDECPDTPGGVTVDRRGCEVLADADADGVSDEGDSCPGTPEGVVVDEAGCPLPADSDGDGVNDADDSCPATAAGVAVDSRGCPVRFDADRDGVADSEDACANTPAGRRVDARGCPLPLDADGDGVSDLSDSCPDTPAGAEVDARGCPVRADADGDGVIDSADACPNTPGGRRVDARGCPLPLDADGDGVADLDDRCPDTPAGVEVDVRGCPLPADADGDGVIDSEDACPNTAAGAPVDARGCPAAPGGDADGDGVTDAEDRCPATPPGERVDASGCAVMFASGTTEILQGVDFVSQDSYQFTPGSQGVLDRAAQWLIAHPDVRVEIAGHTDNTDYRQYSLIRSLGRASAVRKYLIAQGVDGSRLLAKGFGPDQPIASNETAAGRARNNRVELRRQN